jgi:hypothetical protein
MGDLLSVGYGSAGVSTFPEQWSRLALIPSLDEDLEQLVSQIAFNTIPSHGGHIVGLSVRITGAFVVGSVTVVVTVNGIPGTLQAVLAPGPTEITVSQLGGIDTYAPDDTIGLHLLTSADYDDGGSPVDLEAWIQVSSATTGGGGGGGAWLTVEPTIQTGSFTASAGTLYLMGNPGKFGNATLPPASSMPLDQAIAFKLVVDTSAWSILPDGGDTIDGLNDPLNFVLNETMNGFGNSWIVLVSDGSGNWEVVSTNRTLRLLHNSAQVDTSFGRPFGTIDFLGNIIASGVGGGHAQVYLDTDQMAQPSSDYTLTYKPGSGLPGPYIFESFSTLCSTIETLRDNNRGATFTILFDDSITSPAVVPSGIYNMTNVTWKGYNKRTSVTPLGAQVEVQQGVQFYDLSSTPNFGQLKRIEDNIHITFTGTTPPNVWTNAFVSNIPGLFLDISRNASIRCTGAGPFYDFTTVAFVPMYLRMDGGSFLNGTYEVVRMTGSFGLQIYMDSHVWDSSDVSSNLGDDTLRGDASAVVTVRASPQVNLSETQTNLVNPFIALWTPHKRFIYPLSFVNAGTVLVQGEVSVWSASGAANVRLPAAYNARGQVYTIKSHYTSTFPLTVTCDGADTVDGVATYPLATANKSVTVISDGISNWEVIAAT